jgi:hypothetical protein
MGNHEDRGQQRLLFLRLAVDLHAGLAQVVDHPQVAGRGQRVARALVGRDAQGSALHVDALDLARLGLFHELGVAGRLDRRLAGLELLEDREEHEGDHHPDGGLREHVVVQLSLLAAARAAMRGDATRPDTAANRF